MYSTWFGRASLGRIDGEEYENTDLAEDLTAIWMSVLWDAGYEPLGYLEDFYWNEGYPSDVIKLKATPEAETKEDLDEYLTYGAEERPSLKRLEDLAMNNGIEAAIEAYLNHNVPLHDIIA